MRTSALVVSAVLASAVAQVSFAQRSPAVPDAPTPPTVTVSDADLETFASIYVDLLDTAARFQAAMDSAQTEEQALEIRTKTQQESIAKVEKRGWTPEKFNSVSQAIDNDPELTEKAVNLIEAR